MTKEDDKEILTLIRELAQKDVVINTLLKVSEVNVRMEMVGERVSKEFLDDRIVSHELKTLIKSILSFQSNRIEGLYEDLKFAQANMVINPVFLKSE
jgi:hypothetical protein